MTENLTLIHVAEKAYIYAIIVITNATASFIYYS